MLVHFITFTSVLQWSRIRCLPQSPDGLSRPPLSTLCSALGSSSCREVPSVVCTLSVARKNWPKSWSNSKGGVPCRGCAPLVALLSARAEGKTVQRRGGSRAPRQVRWALSLSAATGSWANEAPGPAAPPQPWRILVTRHPGGESRPRAPLALLEKVGRKFGATLRVAFVHEAPGPAPPPSPSRSHATQATGFLGIQTEAHWWRTLWDPDWP